MEASAKRRGIIKTVIIIFLSVMLILTFFSNTIMNKSLPEVAAQYAQNGSITAKLRLTANVEANSKQNIVIEETRKIKSVAVRDGQDVQVGDVLIYLEDGESAELVAAREELKRLERDYTAKTLALGEDYYAEELAIRNKQKELSEATEKLNGASVNSESIANLEALKKSLLDEQKALTKRIESYNREIGKLEGSSAGASLTGESTALRLSAAKAAYDAALSRYESAEAARDAAEEAHERAEKAFDEAKKAYNSAIPDGAGDLEALNEQISELEKTMRRAKEDFDLAVGKLYEELEVLDDLWNDAYNAFREIEADYDTGLFDVTYAEMRAAREKAEAAEAAYKQREAELQPQIDALTLAYERGYEDNSERLAKLTAQRDRLSGASGLLSAYETAEKKLEDAAETLADSKEEFSEAEAQLTEKKAEYESLVSLSTIESHEVSLEALEVQNEELTKKLEDISEELAELGGDVDEKEQKKIVDALSEELASLRHNLSRRLMQDGIDAKLEELELNDLTESIEKQREEVKKLEENSTEAKIIAEVAGQVSGLTVANGSETTVGQTLCQIVVSELGYSCHVTLTTEQARRVRVGDPVEITNLWWSNAKGTITALRNDPKNPGSQKIADISITGDVAVGQSLQLTIGEKGQNYDTIVPNSAIREDNNGKFVLVVEAKSTPLGNRYTARRYDIEVLASDDVNTAVKGLLGSEFIITTSSAPIVNGNQVRLSEN